MRRSLIAACIILLAACKDDPDPGRDAAADAIEEAESDAALDTAVDVAAEPTEIDWPEPPWNLCTDADEPEGATVITAFELADQYFNPEDLRTIETSVDFPEGTWAGIGMKYDLTCPADGDCDNWDRLAYVTLVDGEEEVELERYITPYNVGMCITTDVTAFAPRLTGTKTIRSFISTWVGPDEPVHGHGWRVTLKFVFHPGVAPGGLPDETIQLWPTTSVGVGDPATTVSDQLAPASVPIPADATRAELRVIVTGHGQGNAFNCAEFCNLIQHVSVNGDDYAYDPWRADCPLNPMGPYQAGTWTYSRSGWCPGALVVPQVFDVTSSVTPGADATIAFSILTGAGDVYENTCRPGAGDTDNLCTGCAFDSSPGNCDYDGGMHTAPSDMVTVQLMLYR